MGLTFSKCGKGEEGRPRGLIFEYGRITHNWHILIIIGLVEAGGGRGVFSKTANLTYNLHILIIWFAFLSFTITILIMIIMVMQV